MPELPEVEVVRRGLTPLTGRVVTGVEVLDARALTRHDGPSEDFVARLLGARLAEPRRRGKFLWFPLETRAEALLVHLGMSGQLLVDDASLAHRHARVRLRVGDRTLIFRDQRTFGSLAVDRLVPDRMTTDLRRPADIVPAQVAHIALDPVSPEFDAGAAVSRLRARRTAIKRAMLDQTLISGIGNIYADEALWAARLHPERPADSLTPAQAGRLLAEVRGVFDRALAEGGTSFDSLYVNVNGESGYFDRSLNAYGRTGEPCPRCGTPIRRVSFMNRSSHFCPRCQRR